VITIPASVYLFVFGEDLVRLVFARGAFNETAVELTSGTIRGISFGLWAFTLAMILLRFLNNSGRNVHAALIFACAFAVNAALNLIAWLATPPHGNGALIIGLGEAARGIVLFAGVSMALRCHWQMARLIALCMPAAAVMAGLGFVIHQQCSDPFMRLFLGGIAGLLACAAAAHFSARTSLRRSRTQRLERSAPSLTYTPGGMQ
jgi:putative peptidoglycan lipid II flippase